MHFLCVCAFFICGASSVSESICVIYVNFLLFLLIVVFEARLVANCVECGGGACGVCLTWVIGFDNIWKQNMGMLPCPDSR